MNSADAAHSADGVDSRNPYRTAFVVVPHEQGVAQSKKSPHDILFRRGGKRLGIFRERHADGIAPVERAKASRVADDNLVVRSQKEIAGRAVQHGEPPGAQPRGDVPDLRDYVAQTRALIQTQGQQASERARRDLNVQNVRVRLRDLQATWFGASGVSRVCASEIGIANRFLRPIAGSQIKF